MSFGWHERKECIYSVNKRPKAEVTKVTFDGDSIFIRMCSPLYYVKNTNTDEVYIFDFDICSFLEDFGIKVIFKETTERIIDDAIKEKFRESDIKLRSRKIRSN